MKNAAQYHIGNHTANRRKTTKGTAQGSAKLYSLDEAAKGRKRDKQGQKKIRTSGYAANGFLRASFLPKLCTVDTFEDCTDNQEMERGFYTSLSFLAAYHQIEPMQTQSYGFPYNMALSFWDTNKRLPKGINGHGLSVMRDNGQTYLATEEFGGSARCLYYIPMIPLYRMLNDHRYRQAAKVLLSVCAYLYHIAGIPYYRQESSYLYYTYLMMEEWIEMDEETDATESYKKEFLAAEWVGDRMEKKLFNKANLRFFADRLSTFRPIDDFEMDCYSLAADALALFDQYPNENIFRNAPIDNDESEDDDYYGVYGSVPMDRYISFIADSKGWLYETLNETINNEFNEYESMDMPTIKRHFNGMPFPERSLDFERRLFKLMEGLCSLLEDY